MGRRAGGRGCAGSGPYRAVALLPRWVEAGAGGASPWLRRDRACVVATRRGGASTRGWLGATTSSPCVGESVARRMVPRRGCVLDVRRLRGSPRRAGRPPAHDPRERPRAARWLPSGSPTWKPRFRGDFGPSPVALRGTIRWRPPASTDPIPGVLRAPAIRIERTFLRSRGAYRHLLGHGVVRWTRRTASMRARERAGRSGAVTEGKHENSSILPKSED